MNSVFKEFIIYQFGSARSQVLSNTEQYVYNSAEDLSIEEHQTDFDDILIFGYLWVE